MQAGKEAGVSRMVLASSAAVYGDNDAIPLKEDLPTCPLSPYAASKNINEIMAGMFTRAYGFDVTCLRYFNVFGPRQNPDSQYAAAIPTFVHRCLEGKPITIYGDGGQTRDLIFVDDVVRANLLAAENKSAPGGIFNVCSGHETRLLDLIDELLALFPNAKSPIFSEPSRVISIALQATRPVQKALGFTPQTLWQMVESHRRMDAKLKPHIYVRNRYLLIADLILIVISVLVSFTLKLELDNLFPYYRAIFAMVVISLAVKPAIYYSFGLYRRLWVYASVNELKIIVVAVSVASVIVSALMILLFIVGAFTGLPRSVLGIDFLLSIIFVGGVRFALRIRAESRASHPRNGKIRNVLVIGAGDAGALVVRELQKKTNLEPIVISDDDLGNNNTKFMVSKSSVL
jgi:FlaA1/EpsC-like NDP-sugar epimerase